MDESYQLGNNEKRWMDNDDGDKEDEHEACSETFSGSISPP